MRVRSRVFMSFLSVFVLLLAWSGPLRAQTASGDQVAKMEEVVVTATRVKEAAKSLPVYTTVITGKELKARGYESVADYLRFVDGLYVYGYGGPGRLTTLRIRGGDASWTMIMVDGMPVNDPSAPDRSFDFSDFSIDDVERIEIVHGPLSPLYGSDAMAGVVNIITKRGKGKPTASLSGFMGSMDTWQTRAASSGQLGMVDYSISASHLETNGVGKDDRYWRSAIALRVGADILENLRVDGTLRFVNGDVQYDDWDYQTRKAVNDPNQLKKSKWLVGTLSADYMPFAWWDTKLFLGLSDHRRKYSDKLDSESTDIFVWGPFVSEQLKYRANYTGRTKKIDWQNTFYVLDRKGLKDTLVVGYEYREDEAKSNSVRVSQSFWGGWPLGITVTKTRFPFHRTQLIGYYAQNELKLWDSLTLLAGFRIEDPDDFGGRTTYNVGASYFLKKTGTVFRARFATAFKVPTLYQLFAPPNPAWLFVGGNRALDPERGQTYEAGITQFLWNNRIKLDVTLFRSAYKKKILYTEVAPYQYGYRNIAAAVIRGVETALTARVFKGLELRAHYTYQDPKNREFHRRLARVPLNEWDVSLFYNWRNKVKTYLGARFVGDRVDMYDWSTGKPYYVNSYTVVDGKVSYQVCKYFQVFVKGENLFNRKYEEVKGYEAPRASWYLGGKLQF